jgi:glycerol uptake facilitator protein
MPLSKKLIAEVIGTWMLVVVGPGAAVLAGDILTIGMAFAFVLVAAIYLCGPVSGAHFNPAVTIGLWATKRFPSKEVLPYILAQCVGAILGSLTMLLMLAGAGGGLGAPGVNPTYGVTGAFVAELVGTYILMLTIMGIAVDKRAPAGWAGAVIGLIVAGVIITLGPISGQGINPARSLGPILVNAITGDSGGLKDLWLYIVAPIIGAILAAFTYNAVIQDKNER